LKAREPSSEAMSAIVSFARKTGDFASLSLTDLRVMALTYMLEAETNGTEHLKQSPEASATITRGPNGKTVVSGEQSTVPCVYFGSVMGCKYGDECRFSHKVTEQPTKANESTSETVKPRKVAIACRYFNTNEGCKFGDECQFSHEAKEEENMKYEEEPEGALSPSDEEEREVKKEILQADIKSRILGGLGTQSNVGASEDDGKNWVTSDNLTKFLDSPFSDGKNVEQINGNITKVGCITTDYSMQNVMLQIGLNLLSTDGMVIRRVKQWILKCIACFTTTTEMERMFCPKCGNSTLERVSYSIGKDGKMVFYHRANRPVKLTGTKFSLPKPKGGRDGDLLLREDQLMMGIWGQRQRQRQQVMKSAFGENVAHDLGVKAERQTNIVVGYGRMNPNAQKGRERRGKKKKNSRH
jgi:RNA-binding protein NOB1